MNERSTSRAIARGLAVGALVLTFFGAIWALAALGNRPGTPAWAYGVVALISLALVIGSIARFVSAAKIPSPPDDAPEVQHGRAIGIWFSVVFAAEFLLIAAAAIILARMGQPLLIPIIVCAIVGIHFFPLARLFQVPVYWVTGALLVLCALVSLLVPDETMRLFMVGLTAAAILWLTAAFILVR